MIGDPLGQPGGFGITYLAWDRTLERRIAVKEFFPRFLEPARADDGNVSVSRATYQQQFGVCLAGFLDEGKRAAQIAHEHVVHILDFLEELGTGYLIMPYYEGETLEAMHDRRGSAALPWRETVLLTLPVVDALRAVHDAGIVHRDVKPANIYLARGDGGSPHPILLDFGAARIAGSARQFTTILTERYAPLEQYDADSTAQGPWTDVYAMAATLLELMTGSRLPPAPSRQFGAALPDLAAAQPGVPVGLVESLGRALRIDPAERTRDARMLHAELRQVLGTGAPATVLLKERGRSSAMRRRIVGASVALGAIGLAGVTGLILSASAPAHGGTPPARGSPSVHAEAELFGPEPLVAPARGEIAPTPHLEGSTRSAAGKPKRQTPADGDSGASNVRSGSPLSATTTRRTESDSASRLLELGDYAHAWIHARAADSPELLNRIRNACQQDSLIAARRALVVSCPR